MTASSFARQTAVLSPQAGDEEPEDYDRPVAPEAWQDNHQQQNDDAGRPKLDRQRRSIFGTLPDWAIASRPQKVGIRRLLWFFYCLLRLHKYDWIPVPRACGSYQRREAENWGFVRATSDQVMAIIATIGGKGGILKTTILTWLAAGWARASTGFTVLVDADSNATTSASRRFEVKPEDTLATSQMSDMILHHGWQPTCEDLVRLLACHLESMVRVTYMPPKKTIAGNEFSRVLKELKPACHTLFVDTTPGRTETNTYGVIDAVTVPILSGKINSDDDLYAIGTTLSYEDYHLQERMTCGDDVLIAIGAVRWRDFNLRTTYKFAERYGVRPDQIVLFPADRYILKTGPVRHSRVPAKYHYANSQLARRCAEAAIRYNNAHPPATVPGEPATLTSGHNPLANPQEEK